VVQDRTGSRQQLLAPAVLGLRLLPFCCLQGKGQSFVSLHGLRKNSQTNTLILLLPSGHYMYHTAVTICTTQRSLYVPHSGHYMYRQFNIQQFHVLPTHCIYVFSVDLRTNSHYFPIQHQLTGFCNPDGVCLLCGTD
jgi:hypothetical protein